MLKEINNETDIRKAFEIYLEAFPEYERFPKDILRKRIEDKSEQIFGYYADNELLGFATVFNLGKVFGKENFAVLNYFAMDKAHRGKSFGEIFLKQIMVDSEINDTILIFEIENPYQCSEKSNEYRRLNFYRRCGCIEYPDFQYYMPAFGGGTVDMRLLSHGSSKLLTNEELITISIEIYKKMYYLCDDKILKLNFLKKQQ